MIHATDEILEVLIKMTGRTRHGLETNTRRLFSYRENQNNNVLCAPQSNFYSTYCLNMSAWLSPLLSLFLLAAS